MMRKISVGAFALVILQIASCLNAQAQSGCVYWYQSLFYGYPAGWVPPLPADSSQCSSVLTGAGYQVICWDVRSVCTPPPSYCPTCDKNQEAAGPPINLANGNTYFVQSDVSIPGLGGGLALQRTWNSMWPAYLGGPPIGLFGPNWRSTYEETLSPGTGDAVNYMVYIRANSSIWYFGPSNGSTSPLASPANATATLTSGSSYWTITFQNGEQRRFDNVTGLLTTIIDRNGNTTSLTYDGALRLTTVTDPVSRHLYFNYANGSSRLVTGVTSDFSMSLSYAYDAQNRLSQVTKPDLSTINFTYNSQSLITSVTDSQGKVLESHTYDGNGHGLTASQANGVNAVTITYPQ
jgi:YD repeat-containing protein